MKARNILILILAILMAGSAGWYFGFKNKISQRYVEENSTAVMNRIEKVFKLVAAEGHVSEIYDYKDYQYYDISPLRKKILVRVNAKVLVGYNFESAEININDETKEIIIDSLKAPEILAIDHDLDYYDIQEGTFNTFSEQELTDISNKAKNYAGEVVKDSDLFKTAEQQRDDLLDMLDVAARSMGWKLIINPSTLKD